MQVSVVAAMLGGGATFPRPADAQTGSGGAAPAATATAAAAATATVAQRLKNEEASGLLPPVERPKAPLPTPALMQK